VISYQCLVSLPSIAKNINHDTKYAFYDVPVGAIVQSLSFILGNSRTVDKARTVLLQQSNHVVHTDGHFESPRHQKGFTDDTIKRKTTMEPRRKADGDITINTNIYSVLVAVINRC